MKKSIAVAGLVALLVVAGIVIAETPAAKPTGELDKLREQNEQILQKQDEILKKLDELGREIAQIRRRTS